MTAQVIFNDANYTIVEVHTDVKRTLTGGIHESSSSKVRKLAAAASDAKKGCSRDDNNEIRWDSEIVSLETMTDVAREGVQTVIYFK